MDESPLRSQQEEAKSEKRQRILEAAARVFAEHGFHGTRISDIARRANVADGTIYLYFQNKQDLIIRLFDETIEKFFSELAERLAHADTAEERLRRLVRVQFQTLDQEPALARLLTVNLRQSHGALRERVAPTYDGYIRQLEEIIRVGKRSGEFRDDIDESLAAHAIYGALDGIILAWVFRPGPRSPLGESADEVTNLILHGLRSQ